MEVAIVVLVFPLSALLIGRTMLKKARVKNPGASQTICQIDG